MQTVHKEDQGDCVTVCLKYLLFVFNFLFWVSRKKKLFEAPPTQTAREKKVVHWPVFVASLSKIDPFFRPIQCFVGVFLVTR